MTTQPVDGWTTGALLFDGDAAQALALRFHDPEVREALETQTGPVGRRLLAGVLTQVAEAVADMPSPDLSDVLVRAWTAHQACVPPLPRPAGHTPPSLRRRSSSTRTRSPSPSTPRST